MAETEGSDDTSENELLNRSLSVWKGNKGSKEEFEPIPLDLHTASSLGLYDCVKAHITRGEVDIDHINKGGWTALMYACYIGHESIVSLLLEQGASVNLRNQKKETSLMLAASCGNDRVGRLLCSQGAELECRDARGWTALFHATYSGHQNMVCFLLKQGANMNAVEPSMGMTPFMEAAAEGHEIIVQLFLQHGVNVNAKAYNGDTARSLALITGNMKIVSLIDNHVMPITSLRAEAGLEPELSSSDDTFSRRNKNMRGGRGKAVGGGPSIMDGPQAIARLINRTRDAPQQKVPEGEVPKGYVTFPDETSTEQPQKLSYRDVTSPINPEDYKLDSSGSRDYNELEDDTNAFSKTGALTIKSSSGSSGGLAAAFGIRREDSLDSDEFPHESSCGDSHHHGNSGESSSDEGLEENHETSQISQTLKKLDVGENKEKESGDSDTKPNVDKKGEMEKKKLQSKKSKELRLTTEKVNEIEVMKNSVSEWIDNVHNSHSVPDTNFETPNLDHQGTEDNEKEAAIKPEYLPKHKHVKSPQHEHISCPSADDTVEGHMHNPGEGHNPGKVHNEGEIHPPGQGQTIDKGHSTGQGHSPSQGQSPGQEHNPGQLHNPGHSHNQSQGHNPVQGHNSGEIHPSGQSHNPYQGHHLVQGHNPGHGQKADRQTHNPISVEQKSSHHEPKHFSGAELIEQVANTLKNYDPRPAKEFLQQSPAIADSAIISVADPSVQPVSALNLLNTASDGYKAQMNSNPHSAGAQSGHHGNQGNRVSVPPPGFGPVVNQYHMYPHQGPPAVSMYPHVAPQLPPTAVSQGHVEIQKEAPPSSNAVFIEKMKDSMPLDLASLLEQLGLSKYLPTFDEQDVDLQVFLSLTDNDLKEIGIKLFGPRKKMMNAIARWHSKAKISVGELEQAYADRLEGEMQEMGVQLQLAVEQLEKLKAQVKQEQQLRNVTESCLMEERGAWQHVQRIIMETRQQCEDFKDVVRKMMQYVGELKSRVPLDSIQGQGQQKRPIRGAGAIKDERGVVKQEHMPSEAVIRKVDYYMQEVTHLLGNVTNNTDRLLGRSHAESPERPYP
ncbi:LOW QUALITY PROTEIN: ankyrin repeat and SAM domain-containing protein 3-like [Mercenaria mercenaria]|uniref:LOW QUALITY PROTEIN: ankyrin repeat and SAM domain-containing protein 3-like n=1 Tax=Mercenaria mercenaria TaxID=6596 RepID=UPI00234F58F1|nr:LOW QUALITY PROTEIN: ankyrin repeat and SAM domain-containing protein 3-like [Mercenaria mercenaria]